MSQLRSKLTYANTVATLALFLALGGGAYAAIQLPRNSVGAKQIKNNAVNSSKVKNGSLAGVDFRQGALPQGPQGPKGDPGAKGDPGTLVNNLVARRVTGPNVPVGQVGVLTVKCLPGETATGGGAVISKSLTPNKEETTVRSYPSLPSSQEGVADGATPTAWTTKMLNSSDGPGTLVGFAICASP